MDPRMDGHLMTFIYNPALLIRMQHGDDRRYKKGGGCIVMGEHFKDSWHSDTGSVFPLAQFARRVMPPAKRLGFVVRVKRKCDGNTSPIRPFCRFERPARPDLVDNAAPLLFWPTPAFRLIRNRMSCFSAHDYLPGKYSSNHNNSITSSAVKSKQN